MRACAAGTPYSGLGQNLAQPHHLRVGGLASLVGAGQDTNAAVVSQVDIVGDDVGCGISMRYLVQRQVEIVRLLQLADALCHGGDLGATHRQTTAAETLHESHGG